MKLSYIYTMLVFVLALNACKKVYPDLPYAEMLSFSLKDGNGETLKGLIEGNDIKVYWPLDQAIPENITPQFTVAEGATVSPASGAQIAFNETTSYTVTAQDGTTKTYTLKPLTNNIIPVIKAVTSAITYNNRPYFTNAQTVQITGDFFNTLPGQVKIFMVSSTNEEVEAKVTAVTPIQISFTPEVKLGTYQKIKVLNGKKSVYIPIDVDVIQETKPLLPLAAFTASVTVKRSGILTLSGGINLQKVTSVQLYNATTRVYVTVPLKQANANSLLLDIPADFVLGDYNRIRYYYPVADYYGSTSTVLVMTNFVITVTE